MDGAAVAERGKLRGEGRYGHLGKRLRGPPALAVQHAHRPHMPIKRQLASALMKDLTVDMGPLLGGEKDAERGDGVGPAAA